MVDLHILVCTEKCSHHFQRCVPNMQSNLRFEHFYTAILFMLHTELTMYMTFDPHSGSGIILVPSCSQPLSLSVSSVHSMTSVTWTLTSLWRESTLMSCGHHLYCESILVLQATPHTLCREERSRHAATIQLAHCDVIVLNDHGCDLQGVRI